MARADDAPSIEGDAEERRLIDRSAAGDQEAFRQLVIRHHRLVINVAFRALGELSLAEDVAQEVFLKVYKALPGYRHEKFFKQAEDGIRDVAVTGVQTCALPIWPHHPRRRGIGDGRCHRRPPERIQGLARLRSVPDASASRMVRPV